MLHWFHAIKQVCIDTHILTMVLDLVFTLGQYGKLIPFLDGLFSVKCCSNGYKIGSTILQSLRK